MWKISFIKLESFHLPDSASRGRPSRFKIDLLISISQLVSIHFPRIDASETLIRFGENIDCRTPQDNTANKLSKRSISTFASRSHRAD
jgi:hypothetical protein